MRSPSSASSCSRNASSSGTHDGSAVARSAASAHAMVIVLSQQRDASMGARRGAAAQRRTLLECMPRGAVFHTLSYLSFSDIVRLLCADKRLRPFANARHFAPWRKRFLKLAAAEAAYEACVRAGEESGDAEDAFVAAYDEALAALQLARAPLQMHEMLHAVVAQEFDADAAQMFLVPWIMGRCEAGSAFARFAAPVAVEMLCFARVFFVVLRLSRHFSSGPSHRPYHQMVHVLDADAESAVHRFFAPRLAPTPPDALTREQAALVAYDVRPTDLVCVQAYAGVRIPTDADRKNALAVRVRAAAAIVALSLHHL